MSDLSSIQLPSIDKEKLRELASQARAAGAKQAQEAKNIYQPSNDVYFREPVKVASSDPEYSRIQNKLGNYDLASKLILSSAASRKSDLLGVERQPATPLPSKQPDEGFFQKPARNSNIQKRLIADAVGKSSEKKEKDKTDHGAGITNRQQITGKSELKNKDDKLSRTSNLDPKPKVLESSSSSHKRYNSINTKESSHGSDKSASSHNQITSTAVKSESKKKVHGESRRHSSSGKAHSPDHARSGQPEKTVTQSLKHEAKTQPVERESVLLTLGKQFSDSVSDSATSHSKSASISPNFEKEDINIKASDNRPVDTSVLKVKEDNRNGMNTFNGSRTKVPLMLSIPEKNIEDMLKELTHIPQPLTALQTPLKEGGNFPFQVTEKLQPISKDLKKTFDVPKEFDASSLEATQTRSSLDQIEPIASPNDDSEDSLSDSSAALEEGEIQSEDSDDDVIAPSGLHSSSNSVSTSKVPNVTTGPPVKGTTAPVKEPRNSSSKMSSGSSDSSSSGSEDSSSSEGESEQDDNAVSEDEEDVERKNETTPPPKSNTPLKEETSPSSGSKQKWDLKSFLNPDTSLLGPSSVKSIDGPGSNKSDANHYIDDVLDEQPMRAADQVISDDNPPSDKIPDDHDIFSKPLSDEFSPPSLPYKNPVMSPIRSPAKASYNRTSLSDNFHNSQKMDSSPHTPTNTYDNVKRRKRTPSVKSPEVQDRTPKSKRGRKPKMKAPILSSDSSSSEDEQEVDNLSSHSLDIQNVKESPKSLPKSPRKSQSVSKTEKAVTPVKASKKKEIKQEKQLVEKDTVRLKPERKPASKASDCDKSVSDKSDLSSTSCTKLESDSIEKIFDTFQPESLLSPIPNVPEKSLVTSVHKDVICIQKEKGVSLNGSVSYCNGKPSVMVQLDLELFSKHIHLDNFKKVGKDVSVVVCEVKNEICTSDKSESRTSDIKGRTTVSSAPEPTAIENSKSENKEKMESAKLTSPEKPSVKVTSNSESCDKSKLLPSVKNSATESVSKSANDSKGACATQKVLHSKSPDYSSFDTLPIRQSHESPSKLVAKKHPLSVLTDTSSSESESSDSEEDHSVEINHLSPALEKRTETCVQVSDFKKRKPDSHRTEDSKRRKTASKSPHYKPSADPIHKEEKHEENDAEWSGKHSSHSDERRNSASSQHSTRSNQSSKSSLSQHSHSGKKARLEPAEESSSISSTNHTSDHASSSYKHPIKSEPFNSESAKPAVHINGHVPELSPHSSASSLGSTDGKRTTPCHFWLNPNVKDDEERLEKANVYHLQAKKVKHQADAMESGLQQNILHLEAALYFLQSGCAMERNHKYMDAATMFKETHRYVVHNHHFRMPHDPESADRAELKLAVLCLRLQSLLYFKLFMLKKNETVKLKKILEDHHNKSVKNAGSQHKPPSAPSPHQTNWNRSTGTPSPMSPTPSPVGSVCSVGSVGSINELTPSKATNGTSATLALAGHVAVPQRIHSITQKYITSTSLMVTCHDLWDQADMAVTPDIQGFFNQLDIDCGRLTMQSSLNHLVRYIRHGLQLLKAT